MILMLGLGRVFGGGAVGPGSAPTAPRHQIQVGEQKLEVEVASTPAAIEQGLSDRSEIGADGMLFVFAKPVAPTFWMLRMQFPLDIIWLGSDRIVQINADVPPPSETDGIPTVVQPPGPVYAVLEVPAGTAQQAGWAVGTSWRQL
jgi:uncharacterized membrane protein (UPF0127 family)